ncbi:MAG: DUF1045 domain-containing protein [Dichotomicrobium sp.]
MTGATERFARYAIFWLPPADSALAQFGREWFGLCPEAGEVGAPAGFGLPADLAAEAVARPRRYTLHGTIVAPFRPATRVSAAEIAAELRRFCARRAVVRTEPLRLMRLARHLALMPEGRTAALDWLAADCVTHFNRFRAPTTDADMARYPAGDYTEGQRRNARQFGYPYVLSDFRFHVTLAGPLAPDRLERVEAALATRLEPLADAPLEIASLCLLGEADQAAPFRLVERCALAA